jgi:hypothetical protein
MAVVLYHEHYKKNSTKIDPCRIVGQISHQRVSASHLEYIACMNRTGFQVLAGFVLQSAGSVSRLAAWRVYMADRLLYWLCCWRSKRPALCCPLEPHRRMLQGHIGPPPRNKRSSTYSLSVCLLNILCFVMMQMGLLVRHRWRLIIPAFGGVT